MANENRDVGFVDFRRYRLSALIMLSSAIVAPPSFVLRQIGLPLRNTSLRDRADEQFGPEHILILLLQSLGVVGKVEHERTHQGVAFG